MSRKIGDWMQTYTGRQFWPMDPDQDDIDIDDIAHHLSQINRFTGATILPYSVAQHSVLMAWQLPSPLRLAGLLHDSAEAYLNDLATPVKRWVPTYTMVETSLLAAIFNKFEIPRDWLPSVNTEIHEADLRMLKTERRDLLRHTTHEWPCLEGVHAYGFHILPWGSREAERVFLREFHAPTGGVSCSLLNEPCTTG